MKLNALILLFILALASCGGKKQVSDYDDELPPQPEQSSALLKKGSFSCIGEGDVFSVFREGVGEEKAKCCEGLGAIEHIYPIITGAQRDRTFACAKPSAESYVCVASCGDGQCTKGENPCNCPKDCPKGELPPPASEENGDDVSDEEWEQR